MSLTSVINTKWRLEMTNKKQPTYAEIWDTLSKVDVSEYVEEKMNLSYISLSRAWW